MAFLRTPGMEKLYSGSGEQDGVGSADAGFEVEDGGQRIEFDVAVVGRDGGEVEGVDGDAGRGEPDGGAEERAVERGLAQAPRDAEDGERHSSIIGGVLRPACYFGFDGQRQSVPGSTAHSGACRSKRRDRKSTRLN